MRKWGWLLVIGLNIILVGCSKLPECADEKSTSLVKEILVNQVSESVKSAKNRNSAIWTPVNDSTTASLFAIDIKNIEQENTGKEEKKFSCKAKIEIYLKDKNIETGVFNGEQVPLITHLVAGHYEIPDDNAKMADFLSNKELQLSINVLRTVANQFQPKDDKIKDEKTGLLQAFYQQITVGQALTPLILTHGEAEWNAVIKRMETLGKANLVDNKLALTIGYTSEVKKIDGKERHFSELSLPKGFIDLWTSYGLIASLYSRGLEDLKKIKNFEDSFKARYVGSWTGQYSCGGLDGAESGPKGPYNMTVTADLRETNDEVGQYEINLSRITTSGGVEKLKSTFKSEKINQITLAGEGRNSADDEWRTKFTLKDSEKSLNGTGEIRTAGGELLRSCKLNLAREQRS